MGNVGTFSLLSKVSAFSICAVVGVEEHRGNFIEIESTVPHRDTTGSESEVSLCRSAATTGCIWEEANILRNPFNEIILTVRIGAISDKALLTLVQLSCPESGSWAQKT